LFTPTAFATSDVEYVAFMYAYGIGVKRLGCQQKSASVAAGLDGREKRYYRDQINLAGVGVHFPCDKYLFLDPGFAQVVGLLQVEPELSAGPEIVS
jgi:hypothetical protein